MPIAQLVQRPSTLKILTQQIGSLCLSGCMLLGVATSAIAQANSKDETVSSRIEFLNGTWEGSYTCRQGMTKLKLVIEATSTTDIDAVFMFSEHSKNPGVPSGRFRMEGYLEVFDSPDIPDLITLEGTKWINQPSGYRTVDLTGDISDSQRKITGNVDTPGCSTFEVIKREQ